MSKIIMEYVQHTRQRLDELESAVAGDDKDKSFKIIMLMNDEAAVAARVCAVNLGAPGNGEVNHGR